VLVSIASYDIVHLAARFLFTILSTYSVTGGAAFSYNHKEFDLGRIFQFGNLGSRDNESTLDADMEKFKPTMKIIFGTNIRFDYHHGYVSGPLIRVRVN